MFSKIPYTRAREIENVPGAAPDVVSLNICARAREESPFSHKVPLYDNQAWR